ncbi:MAG: MFS transporter [Actinomycetaceae bacterium]|nr:MFS transporter [Actinomycetaceae bacterium]
MLNSYRDILSIPGAWKFSLAGLIARFPMSIVGISQILMISMLYGSYTLAGQVAATNVISFAIFAPFVARLVDRFGQARVMIPSIAISTTTLMGLMIAAAMHAPVGYLYVLTAISGATSGSLGSMVRSRWTVVVKSPAQLHTAFAMESTLDEFVFMLGPILATVLAANVHPLAGMILAFILAVTGGFWLLSQRDTEPPVSASTAPPPKGSVMAQPVMVALALVYVGAGAMFGAIDISVVAFTESLGKQAFSGVLLGVFAFGSMLAGLLYGARTSSIALWKLFVGGVVFLALGVSLTHFARSMVGLGVILFITGFSISPTMINVTAMVQRAVPPRRLTEGLTWMSTAMNVGTSLGSAAAGRVVDQMGSAGGFRTAMWFAWVMVTVSLIAIPALRSASRKNRAHIPVQVRSRRTGLGKLWRRRPRKSLD